MIYGVDCDLNRIYVVDAQRNVVLNHARLEAFLAFLRRCEKDDTVLFEIASAIDYTEDEQNTGKAFNKRRWMLFNMHAATAGDAACGGTFLVSPSSEWSNGYKRDMRCRLAECKTGNKDLREAECMTYFYGKLPEKWVSLGIFVSRI